MSNQKKVAQTFTAKTLENYFEIIETVSAEDAKSHLKAHSMGCIWDK